MWFFVYLDFSHPFLNGLMQAVVFWLAVAFVLWIADCFKEKK